MAKKMLIDATHAEETRVVVVDGNKVEEFDFESENKRQLAGNIYLAKVTRVEPSLQAAFVDYGGNRHGFLAFSEIHPDYYQIPLADRQALLEEDQAEADAQSERDEAEDQPKKRTAARRGRSRAARATSDDAVARSEEIAGMETIALDDDEAPQSAAPDSAATEARSEARSPVSGQPEAAPETETETVTEGEGLSADLSEAADGEAEAEAAEDDGIEIESVADDDDSEDIRPPRKPRPRRYKIQEVIKVRQIMLVQVVKEERGNKGAALTTYLSLAGRYCVLMPNTARGGGISRKITNAADRKKLKEIAAEIDVPKGAGLIIRTAGAQRTKSEIKRDYEYLQRLWEQIRDLTLKSIAPAKIYEEGNLIKRAIRDLYNREIDEVLVEGEQGYRVAKDFMKMIMPSHAKNVKHYTDPMPLFARFQVESYLSSMFNPVVQLPSGGYIVIDVTEALVAIDVNSGRSTKEGSVEETALKTNLEAAEEVARQLRLRDLAGLIVIDFIDMDERKNNLAVEKRLKERLKSDRARIQMGRISGFGLLEMSRQRLRPGMIEASTQPCPACHGTGLLRSDDSLALSILRQIEEEGVRRRSREVLVTCPVGIANFLMNQKREHIAQIEARYGLSIRIEGDPTLISPDFVIEKFKTATRAVPEAEMVISVDSMPMDAPREEPAETASAAPSAPADSTDEAGDEEGRPKKRRRRRRRRSKSSRDDGLEAQEGTTTEETGDAAAEVPSGELVIETEPPASETVAEAASAEVVPAPDAETRPKPKRTRKPRRSAASGTTAKTAIKAAEAGAAQTEAAAAPSEPATGPSASQETGAPEAPPGPDAAAKADTASPSATPAARPEAAEAAVAVESVTVEETVIVEAVVEMIEAPSEAIRGPGAGSASEAPGQPAETTPQDDSAQDGASKPKRRGWWSLGR